MPKKSFLLRIDNELWKSLNSWAKDEFRSVNGQIEYLLREAVKKQRKQKLKEEGEKEGNS